MGHGYLPIGWNRQKRIYDLLLSAGLLLYLSTFVIAHAIVHPEATVETAAIRALGTCALLMLHVILSIGPLARLDRRFLPLLYNRRHLGVTMFCVAAAHGVFSIVQFHALSDLNPLVSVLVSDGSFASGAAAFPFQPLGAVALAILFVMAATSHDFWLANLTAPVWKTLHMLVYAAYAMLIAHVALGALQSEISPLLFAVVAAGAAWIVALHIAAALRGRKADLESLGSGRDGWIDAGPVEAVAASRPLGVTIAGERVAIVRNGDAISAISAVCRHQNGPLDEGRVIEGCVTCPWHGYQYVPETGASPPPFTEKVPTFDLRIEGGRIFVNPVPHPPGTRVEPVRTSRPAAEDDGPFYVGYLPSAPAPLAAFARRAVVAIGIVIVTVPPAIVLAEAPFAPSRFEFGTVRTFEGVLRERPYPALEVGDGVRLESRALVAPGKFGASGLVRGRDGTAVRLSGKLIERRGRVMIEVVPGSIAGSPERSGAQQAAIDEGTVTVRGEIVDGKCFLGVMNPGATKVHRACAVRCISGGAPPILWIRDGAGSESYLTLTGEDGRPVGREVLDLVAEPVEVTGKIERVADRWYLRADPRTVRRLP